MLEVYFSSLYLRQFLFRSELTWLCKMLTRYFFLTLISKLIYSWRSFLILPSNPFHRSITGLCFFLLWSEISKHSLNPKSISIHALTSLCFAVVSTIWHSHLHHPVWRMKKFNTLWSELGSKHNVIFGYGLIKVSWCVPLWSLID